MTALKQIPIKEVAEALGVQLIRTGGDSWAMRDPDGRGQSIASSLTIFVNTNSFVRFSGIEQGGCSRGSTIDLVRHVTDNSDIKSACEFLSRI